MMAVAIADPVDTLRGAISAERLGWSRMDEFAADTIHANGTALYFDRAGTLHACRTLEAWRLATQHDRPRFVPFRGRSLADHDD